MLKTIQSSTCCAIIIKVNSLFKLSIVYSNFTLTLGYLNTPLNNQAQVLGSEIG